MAWVSLSYVCIPKDGMIQVPILSMRVSWVDAAGRFRDVIRSVGRSVYPQECHSLPYQQRLS
jgi:hypothetical protein